MLPKAFLRFGSLLTMSLAGPVFGGGSVRPGNTSQMPTATSGRTTRSRISAAIRAPIFDVGFDFCLVLAAPVASKGAVSDFAVASSVSVASRSQGATSVLADAAVGAG